MTALALEAISRRFGTVTALDGLSLEIGKGERVAVLGPSGCGKTTLLRLIAGLEAPDQGRVVLDGRTASGNGRVLVPPERRRVGMVFQDLALWPHLTVRGNILFGLWARDVPRRERRRRLRQVLALTGLEGLEARRPAQLSGGQRQRVALARALVLEPEILLLDEPLSSLDRHLRVRLREEIVVLHRRLGFTLIHVTHQSDEAFAIAERIVMLDAGRLVFDGSVSQARDRAGIDP